MASRSLRVLVVEDSRSAAAALARTLAFLGHRPLVTYESGRVLSLYRSLQPDLVLLDVEMPDTDGFALARAIRAEDPQHWTPIIFCSGRVDEASLHEGIESGGDDYLFKPVSQIVLAAKIRAMERIDRMRRELVDVSNQLREANHRLERLSAEDPLTGLSNRRALESALEREYARAHRRNSSLALVLIDVDYFKRYNDSAGHVEGDRCLKAVAHALGLVCRRSADMAARYGGEEFSLILPDTSLQGATSIVSRIKQILRRIALPHPDSPISPYVTFSAGIVAGVPPANHSVPELLDAADRAMYLAKTQGRNRHFATAWEVGLAGALAAESPGEFSPSTAEFSKLDIHALEAQIPDSDLHPTGTNLVSSGYSAASNSAFSKTATEDEDEDDLPQEGDDPAGNNTATIPLATAFALDAQEDDAHDLLSPLFLDGARRSATETSPSRVEFHTYPMPLKHKPQRSDLDSNEGSSDNSVPGSQAG